MVGSLNEASRSDIDNDGSGSTIFVKNAQALQLGKVVIAVGVFSIFEARAQDSLGCTDGFAELREILRSSGQLDLLLRFQQFAAAVNVLKHGRGRSYDWLLTNEELPFIVKARDQGFFFEGDVSEADTLVLVDDTFVFSCAKLVEDVIDAVRNIKPNVFFG